MQGVTLTHVVVVCLAAFCVHGKWQQSQKQQNPPSGQEYLQYQLNLVNNEIFTDFIFPSIGTDLLILENLCALDHIERLRNCAAYNYLNCYANKTAQPSNWLNCQEEIFNASHRHPTDIYDELCSMPVLQNPKLVDYNVCVLGAFGNDSSAIMADKALVLGCQLEALYLIPGANPPCLADKQKNYQR